MHKALSDALMRPAGGGREIIWSDSLYTINMTTGRWRPRCPRNREIVASTRGLWRRVQRQRDAEVELRHVRSHTRVPGNELADWLAEIGRTEGGRPVRLAWACQAWALACPWYQHLEQPLDDRLPHTVDHSRRGVVKAYM